MKDISIYIHIPFCLKKCNYCDFYSIGIKEYYNKGSYKKKYNYKKLVGLFINSLKNEMDFYSKYFFNISVSSIYIGGGTPSFLNSNIIIEILHYIYNRFKIANNCEITIEANPEDLTESKLIDYKTAGINRLSLGIQSFDDNDLQFLERRGSREKNLNSIELAKKYFDNISCDLIAGLPYSDIAKSLEILSNYAINHISVYMLTVYKNLKLYSNIKNKIDMIEKKIVNDYLKTLKWMNKNKFIQYEISNFAKSKKYYSKHNLRYWKRKPYLGFGPAAAGFFDNIRYSNGYICQYIELYNKIYNKIYSNKKNFSEKYYKNKERKDDCENSGKVSYLNQEKVQRTLYFMNNLENVIKNNGDIKNKNDIENSSDIGNSSEIKNNNIRKNTKNIVEKIKYFYLNNSHMFNVYENLTDKEIEEEYIMLSLRMNRGLSLELFKRKFGRNFIKEKDNIIDTLIRDKKVELKNGYFRIIPESYIYFNDIVSKLI